MNVFDLLAQMQDPVQREQLVTQLATAYDLPAETFAAAQSMTPPAGGVAAESAPANPQQQMQRQGQFTSPVGSEPPMAPALPGTQGGVTPEAPSPVEQQDDMQRKLAALLAGGGMPLPQMGAPEMPIMPPVSGGPSLGSASSPQFNPTASMRGQNSQLALAQLLGG